MDLSHLIEFWIICAKTKRFYFSFMRGKIGIRKMKRYNKGYGPQIISRFLFFKYPIIWRIKVEPLINLKDQRPKSITIKSISMDSSMLQFLIYYS